MLLQKLVAKNNDGQFVSLYDHSIAVADKCLELFSKLNIKDEKLEKLCYVCGLLHDIGKCSEGFQKHITKDSKEYVYHNVLGSFMIKYLFNAGGMDEYLGNIIANVVMFHHPVNEQSDKELSKVRISDKFYSDVVSEYIALLNKRFPTVTGISLKQVEEGIILKKKQAEYYHKEYNNNKYNVYLFIISCIVKFADTIVSKNEPNYESIVYRKNALDVGELKKPEDYDERFDIQLGLVDNELSKYNMSVFKSETGFGKTMLGLLYALKSNNRKVYWVCPRNSIAEGIYDRLVDEINKLKLSDKLSVGLLLTNEWKKGNEESDITVTNIDNFLRPVIKNDALSRTYNSLFSTVIFDEFHEYLDKSSLMAFFDIMLKAREMTDSKTLCLSATPAYDLIPNDSKANKVEYVDEKISKRKYQIEFCEDLDQLETRGKGYLVSVNATRTAQDMYSDKRADKVMHSRFMESGIDKRMGELMEEFGKKNRNTPKNTTWAATNIISTGLDISFDSMIIKSPTPNRFIQAIGRCNRWNDGNPNHRIVFCPLKTGTEDRSEGTSLDNMGLKAISKTLYNDLKKRFGDAKEVEFKELYEANEESTKTFEYKAYINDLKETSYQNLQEYISYDFATVSKDHKADYLPNAPLRRTGDGSKNFYVKFPGIEELFVGNSIIFDFENIFRNNRRRREKFEEILRKGYRENTDYFKNKKQADNMNDIIGYLMGKARDKKTPFPMLRIFGYDNNLGVIKLKENNNI